MAVLGLRLSVTGFSPHMPGSNARPLHLEFVVDRVTLGQVFL